jgi:hypothetical protein
MYLTADVEFSINDVNGTQQHKHIHFALIRNQPITVLLINIGCEITKLIDLLYSKTFQSTIY